MPASQPFHICVIDQMIKYTVQPVIQNHVFNNFQRYLIRLKAFVTTRALSYKLIATTGVFSLTQKDAPASNTGIHTSA